MGNGRAALAVRGVALAPRGSTRDELLREFVQRERNERFAAVELFARLIGKGLGLPEEAVDRELDLYGLELSQDRYRPSIVAAARAARATRKKKAESDTKLLQRVEGMTVADEDLPPVPGERRSRTGRR